MSEVSMARNLNLPARVSGLFTGIKTRVFLSPESFTFEKEAGVWKQVTPGGKVAASEGDVKIMERLQSITGQVRELSK